MNSYVHLYQLTTEEAEIEAARIRPEGDYSLECLGAGPDLRGTWIVDWTPKSWYVVGSGHPAGEVYDREVIVMEAPAGLPKGDERFQSVVEFDADYVWSKFQEFLTKQEADEYAAHISATN